MNYSEGERGGKERENAWGTFFFLEDHCNYSILDGKLRLIRETKYDMMSLID